MKRKIGVVLGLLVICLAFLAASSCEKSAKQSAVAVNKYAESLSAFQDAEIKMHDLGKIDDQLHRQILLAEKKAAKTGMELDQAILLAAHGASYDQYIDQAQKSFDELQVLALVSKDPQTQEDLKTLIAASGMLLKNAISLIKAIQPQKSSSPAMWVLFLFPIGMAATASGLAVALQLIQAIMVLEPIAVDLLLKLAQDLKGKSTEEVVAMNEKLFGKVDSKADDELRKLDEKEKQGS